ncbi:hypothetical protein A3F06_04510 [candidate division TM6 bacterium RIFCSPHIGHO2_12_FULL_36_22]|nr:MAG: hypothetical protein A3F06_04510 [candidate division TM6 bacterium RIFCSPHIGHO2_12_FULL_36_22]
MKLCPSDKYNIAWFKLAEIVARGEKERAIGMFKLLMHSINNQALAYQLQGDLLLSFEDAQAIDCYKKSAALYIHDKKYIQAAAIYEHLLSLNPETILYIEKLIDIYQALQYNDKIFFYFKKLIALLTSHNKLDEAHTAISQFGHLATPLEKAMVSQLNLFTHLGSSVYDNKAKTKMLHQTIDHLLEINNSHHLNAFLKQLENSYKEFYTQALNYLEKKS